MGEVLKILPHYTYDDYEKWEGQWELIDGIPYAMSPMPVPKHQRIATALSSEFHVALKKCKTCTVYQPIDYKVEDDTILQPDMLVVCGETREKYLDFPPSLVVEILSPSTALKDRHAKFSIYEFQKIPYYLIVSLDPEEIEVYEYENDGYVLKERGRDFNYTFSFGNGCECVIDFKEIW